MKILEGRRAGSGRVGGERSFPNAAVGPKENDDNAFQASQLFRENKRFKAISI
jgi:hypothetical protein